MERGGAAAVHPMPGGRAGYGMPAIAAVPENELKHPALSLAHRGEDLRRARDIPPKELCSLRWKMVPAHFPTDR